MADNQVTIKLVVEGNAKTELKKIQQGIENFSQKGQSSLSKFNVAFGVFAGHLASRAVTAGIGLISRGIRDAATNFLEFDQAISEVNSLLGKNEKLTKKTTDTFIKFSSQFGSSATGQAEAFYQIISSGISDTTEATELLSVANTAAVAGLTEVETAVDGLTNVINAYGASNINATEASDILFTAVKEGKTTFPELAANIGKVNTIAAAAKVEFSEVAGSLAFLTKVGVSTEEATTSLRATIASIIKPTTDQTKAANKLGLEFNAAALESKGLGKFLDEVRIATGGSTQELVKLFPNIRALTAVTAFSGDGFKDFNRILEETQKASGATSKAFKKIASSASFQFKALKQSISNVGVQMMSDLEPAFAAILTALVKNTKGMNDFNTSAEGFITVFKVVITVIDVFGRAVTAVFTTLGMAVGAVEFALEGFIGTLAFVVGEMSKFIPGMSGFTEGLKKIEEAAAAASNKTGKQLVGGLNAVWNSLSGGETTLSKFRDDITEVKDATEKAAEATNIFEQGQKELAETMREITEDKKIQNEELNESDAQYLESFINKNRTTLENELETLKQLKRINKDKAADHNKMTVLIAKQEKKLSNAKDKIEKDEKKRYWSFVRDKLNATSDMFGNLSSLMNSGSEDAFKIGQASAIAQAGVDGLLGAGKAFNSFAGLGPIGVALGIAAAASVAIATAVRISNISSIKFQKHKEGITTIPGVGSQDNYPAMLAPGERVVDAGTNEDLKAFLGSNGGSQSQILAEIRDSIDNLQNSIVVNIGGEALVDELIDAQRGGRTIEVA